MAMTKKEMFAEIIAMANGAEFTATTEEIVEFAEHEIELLSRKSSGSRKPTKTQVENEGYKTEILEALEMAESPMSISDLQETVASLSELANQRISALLNQLIKADKVVRIKDKKKTFYAIANSVED